MVHRRWSVQGSLLSWSLIWDPDARKSARRKENSMNLENDRPDEDEMRPEYDLRGGVRGKYYKQYMEGTNVVLLDSDVAAIFRDSESVNQALRVLMKAAGQIDQMIAQKGERA